LRFVTAFETRLAQKPYVVDGVADDARSISRDLLMRALASNAASSFHDTRCSAVAALRARRPQWSDAQTTTDEAHDAESAESVEDAGQLSFF
jgi:hypothetical protein